METRSTRRRIEKNLYLEGVRRSRRVRGEKAEARCFVRIPGRDLVQLVSAGPSIPQVSSRAKKPVPLRMT